MMEKDARFVEPENNKRAPAIYLRLAAALNYKMPGQILK
jgi:hypothetical protein